MRQKETARCPHCSMPVYLTEYDTIHYNYCGCNSEGHDDVATDECCEITYDAFICDGVIKYYYHDDDYVVVPLSGFFCAFDPGYIKQIAEISKIIRQCERDISTTDKKLITATLRQCNKTLKTLLRTTMDVNTPH